LAQRLLPAAEMFSTFSGILDGNLSAYPESVFTEAWKDAIFPDHGMGGVGNDTSETSAKAHWFSDNYPDVEGDSDIVDVAMWVRVKNAVETAETYLTNATTAIANKILFTQTANEPMPIVVFNTLSWERSDPIICTITPNGDTWGIIDADGQGVNYQILSESGSNKEIVFIAQNVPSLGCKTYYLVHRAVTVSDTSTTHTDTNYANDYYDVTLTSAGIQSMRDKDINQTLLASKAYRSSYYKPGTDITLTPFELFTLNSAYDDNYLYYDAGAFPEVPPAFLDDTFVQGKDQADWAYDASESGDVRDVYSFNKVLNNSSNWWATITEKLIFYRELKRLDCEITLTNWGMDADGNNKIDDDTIKLREWRMALPLTFTNNKAKVTYEVPMGTLLVGRDEIQDSLGSFYNYDTYDYSQLPNTPSAPSNNRPVKASYIHPREVQNFVSVSDGDYGVTMSSCAAVCDYIFPPREQDAIVPDAEYNIENPMIQPLLLATRKSNRWSYYPGSHGLYSQRGNHTFTFSVLSHEGDWSSNSLRGARFGIQANNPLRGVVLSDLPAGNNTNTLNETKSFCSVSPDNILVSAFKKMDGESNNAVVRMYDIMGGTGTYNATLNFFFSANSADKTSIIEEMLAYNGSPQPALGRDGQSVTMEVGHHSIETLSLTPGPYLEVAVMGEEATGNMYLEWNNLGVGYEYWIQSCTSLFNQTWMDTYGPTTNTRWQWSSTSTTNAATFFRVQGDEKQ
jgi:alpha-mannosidase